MCPDASVCVSMCVFVCLWVCVHEHTSSQTYWLGGCLYSSFRRNSKQESCAAVQMLFPEGMYETGAVCWKMAVSRGEGWSDSWHLAGEIWTRGGGDTRSFHGENEAASDFPCLSRNLPLWPAVYGRNMQAERKTVLPRGRKK